MDMWHIRVLVAVVSIFLQTVFADLTVAPRNTTAKVGDPAYLNCSTSLVSKQVYWYHGTNFVYRDKSFYDPYRGRFELEQNSPGVYNLIITSVNSDDAGTYICEDDEGFGQKRQAELIVLEDDPSCATDTALNEIIGPNNCGIEPDEVKLTCNLTYNGNIPPKMVWKRSGDNATIAEGVTMTTVNKTVTYTLTFKANDMSNNELSFICETLQATNLQYSCSTPETKILYAFGNFTRLKKSSDDEEIVCSANSSQNCSSYKWRWFKDQDLLTVSEGSVLKPEKIGNHRCEAECQMRNKSCVIIPMIIEVYSSNVTSITEVPVENTSMMLWLVVVIAIVAVLVIVAVIVTVLCVMKRKRKKRPEKKHQKNISPGGESGDVKTNLVEKDISTHSMPSTLNQNDPNIKDKKQHFEEKGDTPESMQLISTAEEGHDQERTSGDVSRNFVEKDRTTNSVPITSNQTDCNIEDKEQHNKDRSCETPARWNTSHGKEIRGLAVGDNKMFVLTYDPIYLEIYDLTTHESVGMTELKEILVVQPLDMIYSQKHKRLFIIDGKIKGQSKKIVAIDENGNEVLSWEIYTDFGNLSIASDGNVILAARKAIQEYSPDGKLIRKINVEETKFPFCAIKFDLYEFLISRGVNDDDDHKVCLVKITKSSSTDPTYQIRNVEKAFNRKNESKPEHLNCPRSLALSENKDVFVLDEQNNRVLILNSDLKFKKEFLLAEHGMQSPVKIGLNESAQKLIVAGNSVNDKDSKEKYPGILVLSL